MKAQQVPTVADLVALKERFYAATGAAGAAARAGTLTGAVASEVTVAAGRVDAACEAFRRARFPRSGRVICALGQVLVVSPAGRTTRRVA